MFHRCFDDGRGSLHDIQISQCGADNKLCIHPCVTVSETTVSAEKPFIVIDDQGLCSPRRVGLESVYVASPDVETADSINAKLGDGLDVVLAHIYNLYTPLQIAAASQVLLFLGLATLSPMNGTTVIQVANVLGVRVAGLLIQAGSEPTEALFEWGDGACAGDASNPGSFRTLLRRALADLTLQLIDMMTRCRLKKSSFVNQCCELKACGETCGAQAVTV